MIGNGYIDTYTQDNLDFVFEMQNMVIERNNNGLGMLDTLPIISEKVPNGWMVTVFNTDSIGTLDIKPVPPTLINGVSGITLLPNTSVQIFSGLTYYLATTPI